MIASQIRAVLFDFDGVICQTEVYRMDRREAQLKKLGLHYDRRELYAGVGGGGPGMGSFADRMDRIFGGQAAYRENRAELLAHRQIPLPYEELLTPNLPETLWKMKAAGLYTAVISNSKLETIEEALRACGIRTAFDVVASGWGNEHCKPDPFFYLDIMGKLDVLPSECIVVEDSWVGIEAGRSAGAFVAALRDRDGLLDQRGSDCILNRIEDLLKLIGLD